MKISESLEMGLSARKEIRGPSITTVALGSQEWFALQIRGSRAMPMGSKVGVMRVRELRKTWFC